VIIGVDPGERRVGVAVADTETRFARPLEVIDTRESDPVVRIAQIVNENEGEIVVVGRPTGLSGHAGPAVDKQQDFVRRLQAGLDVPVEDFDERLTTVAAERRLREGGAKASRARSIKDAVAAQLMLQDYLDSSK
jgi:putative holliday junction resolvase